MKYENLKEANAIAKQITKKEMELEKLASYKDKPMKIVIFCNGETISTVGVGDYEHAFTKTATAFIEDCIQLVRDELTKLKKDLDKL